MQGHGHQILFELQLPAPSELNIFVLTAFKYISSPWPGHFQAVSCPQQPTEKGFDGWGHTQALGIPKNI